MEPRSPGERHHLIPRTSGEVEVVSTEKLSILPEHEGLFLFANGVDAETGDAVLPALTPAEAVGLARQQQVDSNFIRFLRRRHRRIERELRDPRRAPAQWVDPLDLAKSGWAVVFAQDDPDTRKILRELAPLLRWREAQAGRIRGRRFRKLYGEEGIRRRDTLETFLSRHEVGINNPDPDRLPYYLLLVGSPERIPYPLQYQLDVQYAVGRLHFDDIKDYGRYAESVVAAERDGVALPAQVTFFGASRPGDQATQLSTRELVQPLAGRLRSSVAASWQVREILREGASKDQLRQLLGGAETPALLFTASHGMVYKAEHPKQKTHQGALLCSDWRGKPQKLTSEHYFAGEDLTGDESALHGLIAFHFACYGAGTPKGDSFAHLAGPAPEESFVSGLAKRLLNHPQGGALAVIGHVDRTWNTAFSWLGEARDRPVYESVLRALLAGHPVGSAMEFLNARHGQMATSLTTYLDPFGPYAGQLDANDLALLWLAHNDARNFVVVGDPAVRLGGGHLPVSTRSLDDVAGEVALTREEEELGPPEEGE